METNNKSSKNAYEIRLNVLQLAKDILESESRTREKHASVRNSQNDWSATDSLKIYTEKDVIEKAQALYAFVNSSSSIK